MAEKNYKQKIVFGMDNICVCKVLDNGNFDETIVPVLGAKA